MKKSLFFATCFLLCNPQILFGQEVANTVRLTTGEVRNTLLFGNSTQNPVNTDVVVRNSASDMPLSGTNNVPQLVASPFVSATSFQISFNSPLLNAGTLQGLRPSDISGKDLDYNPRVSCDSIDIGAMEYPVLSTVFTLQPVDQGICEGMPITIQAEAQGTGLITYRLQRNGTDAAPVNTTGTFTLDGHLTDAGQYRVIAQGSCCSDTSNTFTITVDAMPMVQLVTYDTTIYEGDAVPLQILSYIGDEVYWETADGTIIPHTDDLVIPNITQTTEFTAVVKNGECSEYATATLVVTVHGSPCVIAIAGPTDTTICVGERYRLMTNPALTTATVTGWEVVGSAQTHEPGELVRPEITTQYVAMGEVRDGSDRTCSSADTLTITVYHVNLTVMPDEEFCGVQDVELTSTPSANVQWHTIAGDSIGEGNVWVQTEENVRNLYVASLTEGRCTKRDTVSIYANPPDLQVFARHTTICEGETLQLTTNIESRFVEWFDETSETILHDEDPIVQPSQGNYIYVAWAWDDLCGNVSDTAFVIVQAQPEFEITPVPEVCPLDPVHLTATPNAFYWTNIEGYRVDNPISPEETMEIVGVYFDGVCTVFDTIVVEVETVDFIVQGDTTIQQGEHVQLWSNQENAIWLEMTAGDPVVLHTRLVQPTDTTIYMAVLETDNCTFTQYVTVYVIPIDDPDIPTDTFDIVVDAGPGCFDGEGWAIVTATGPTGPYTYLWSNNVQDTLNTDLQPGTYTVTVTDADGKSKTATVTVPPSTPVSITVQSVTSAGTEDCIGGSIFTTIAGGAGDPVNFMFEWSDQSVGQDLINVESGTYMLTVIDEMGCEYTESVPIPCSFQRVMPTLYISPNNDGDNDYLGIKHIERYPINTVIILNSSGDEVNRIVNYDNYDPNRRWDGRNKRNQVLPDGIYYYIIEAEGVKAMAGWLLMKASKSK